MFTWDGEFLLSQDYRNDHIDRFLFDGKVSFPPGTFCREHFDPDMDLFINKLNFNWSAYPFEVSDLNMSAVRTGSHLVIDHFKGNVGNSMISLSGFLDNFTDSLLSSMKGRLVLNSELIDLDEILKIYYASDTVNISESSVEAETVPAEDSSFFSSLSSYSYPELQLQLGIEKIRYETAIMDNLNGKVEISPSKVFKIDSLSLVSASGGNLFFNGEFSVLNPDMYILGAKLELNNFNIKDLNLNMEYDSVPFSMKDNFAGILSVKGLAEICFTPDMSLNLEKSTAFLNVLIKDGEIMKFAPMHELARYFGNKDLDDVRFAELRSNFTLIDGRVYIPLTSIGSTIGQILVEGEHGFDNTYSYILRVPPYLVKGAAWSAMTYREGKETEGENMMMNAASGKYVVVTIKGDGDDIKVKVGDKKEEKVEK